MLSNLNPAICAWCANRHYQVCEEHCQEEGRYRYLAPASLRTWEAPPALPPFSQLMELPAIERLALIYLAAAYAQSASERDG